MHRRTILSIVLPTVAATALSVGLSGAGTAAEARVVAADAKAAGNNWGIVTEFRGARTLMCRDADADFRYLYYRHDGRYAQKKSRSIVNDKASGDWHDPVRLPWVEPGDLGQMWMTAFGKDLDWPVVQSEIVVGRKHKTRRVESTDLPRC